MRILHLTYLFAEFPQLFRKVDAQVRGLARQHECCGYIFGPRALPESAHFVTRHIPMSWSTPLYFAAASALIAHVNPDIVYFRYLAADAHFYSFMRRHNNIVLEHNTIEEAEYQAHQLHAEQRYGAKIIALAAGQCCVTDEILAYERSRLPAPPPGMVIGNGIATSAIPALQFDPPDDAVHLLCAAHFDRWHGVDRVISGMAAYRGDTRFVLHLAGHGPAVQAYAEQAQALGIADRVRFYGLLDRAALDALTSRCHVAVGALGIHRKALRESAAIKLREYCAQGIPFFFSGADPDFNPVPDFARTVPNDESPVDMRVAEELAHCIQAQPHMRAEMRRHAETRLDWNVKSAAMGAFLEHCARTRPLTDDAREAGLWLDVPEVHLLCLTQWPYYAPLTDVLDAHLALMQASPPTRAALHALAAQHSRACCHLWQGLLHEGDSALPEAIAAYLRAAQGNTRDWQPLFRLAMIYGSLGHTRKAAAFAAQCQEREPLLAGVFEALSANGA